MSSTRERLLAVLLLGVIFTAGGGFLGYQFLYRPVAERQGYAATLTADIAKANDRVAAIQKDLPRLEKAKKRSLPADIDLARREYEGQVSRMLREAQFIPTSITIDSRPPETTGVPVVTPRKPAYSRLTYTVQARGTTESLVDFLEAFYSLDLLHQIKKISVQRVATATAPSAGGQGGSAPRNEVDVGLTLEAIVLDQAEKRKTLTTATPTGLASLASLASAKRDYGAIAGKDIFFGPPPVVQVAREEVKEPFDVTPYVRLTSVTRSEMWTPGEELALGLVGGGAAVVAPDPGRTVATVFDMLHRHEFEVEATAGGTPKSQGYYFIADRKRKMIASPFLALGDDSDNSRRYYRVVRLDSNGMLLQRVDPRGGARLVGGIVGGGLFAAAVPETVALWRVGQRLEEARELSADEARAFTRELPGRRGR